MNEAKSGDLPVEPTGFQLIVNSKAARARSFTIPSTSLLRADEFTE